MPTNAFDPSYGYSGEQPHGGSGGGEAGSIIALLQLAGSLYDSHQNRKTSRENTDKTIAANKAEAELAYQRSVAMWNAQNMYNSPEAQMARFRAAGLNPHLIYGQGSPGNASGFPQYQPANMQYRYESGNYGAAFNSVLPTLMAVGTWMQNMRLSEAELRQKSAGTMRTQTEIERARQLIDYLKEKNPKLLQELDNRLSMYPYQASMQKSAAEKGWRVVADLEREYQYKWGEKLFDGTGTFDSTKFDGMGDGMRKLQFLAQAKKNLGQDYANQLAAARSSWSDFSITDPQALMQLVLSGVMGLAGQTLRLSTHRGAKTTHEVENRMSTGRTTIRRRTYER